MFDNVNLFKELQLSWKYPTIGGNVGVIVGVGVGVDVGPGHTLLTQIFDETLKITPLSDEVLLPHTNNVVPEYI